MPKTAAWNAPKKKRSWGAALQTTKGGLEETDQTVTVGGLSDQLLSIFLYSPGPVNPFPEEKSDVPGTPIKKAQLGSCAQNHQRRIGGD